MKNTLTQTLTEFAEFRTLERELTGRHDSTTHRIYAVLNNGETKEIGANGDAYEMMQTIAVKLMVNKLSVLRDISALILETQANVCKADETGENPDPTFDPLDVVVTVIHDGEETACYVSAVRPEIAEAVGFDTGIQDGEGSGKLAEALEKLTLSVFMAQAMREEDDD
jgi:hypothetical protein